MKPSPAIQPLPWAKHGEFFESALSPRTGIRYLVWCSPVGPAGFFINSFQPDEVIRPGFSVACWTRATRTEAKAVAEEADSMQAPLKKTGANK